MLCCVKAPLSISHPLSRSPVGPRSHTHGSWFPLVRANARSGSCPTSHCCLNNAAKQADAALGRRSSAGHERKGHHCGQRRPSSTTSDWTAASLVGTGWSLSQTQSQRQKVARHRDRHAGSSRLNLTTRWDLTSRGQRYTSRPCCQLTCQNVPTSWLDIGRCSR